MPVTEQPGQRAGDAGPCMGWGANRMEWVQAGKETYKPGLPDPDPGALVLRG